jgi:Ligand-gated ion channel
MTNSPKHDGRPSGLATTTRRVLVARFTWKVWALTCCCASTIMVPLVDANVMGGERLLFDTPLLTPNITHRQNVCDRYEEFRSGTLQLRDALQGLALRPLVSKGDYFLYNSTNGIDTPDPGLMAELMDELALRAGFTWRQSFAVFDRVDMPPNVTFTDLLAWAVDTYDIAINWWDQSVERMERGVAFVEPWFDGSVILIEKQRPVNGNTINLLNWLRPFDGQVWMLVLCTIIFSGLVYQCIEYMHDERESRPLYQWLSDNLYLSAMNFTQNYQYAPNCFAGRIYGVSMGIWALVMTATYTANLANLFVEQGKAPVLIESIDQAIVLGIPICTYRNTNADILIRETYKNAIRVPKSSELEAYQALQTGECGLVAGYLDNWLTFQGNKQYNPTCQLQWIGRTVETIKSGFAVKADAGYKCTSLIRDVINLHLTELMDDGILANAWEKHRLKNEDIDCETYDPESEVNVVASLPTSGRQRTLRATPSAHGAWSQSAVMADTTTAPHRSAPAWIMSHGRKLAKGGGNSAASSGAMEEESDSLSSSLNMQQMLGCFVLHWAMMVLALFVGAVSSYIHRNPSLPDKLPRRESIEANHQNMGVQGHHNHRRESIQAYHQSMGHHHQRESIIYRKHGPIVGVPPPVNTTHVSASFRSRDRVGPMVETYDYDDDDTDDGRFDGDGYDEFKRNHKNKLKKSDSDQVGHYNQPNTIPSHSEDYYDGHRSNSHLHVNESVARLQADYLASQELYAAAQRESQRLLEATQREWRASHEDMQSQLNMAVTLLNEMRQNRYKTKN